jgi:hypothetical protein
MGKISEEDVKERERKRVLDLFDKIMFISNNYDTRCTVCGEGDGHARDCRLHLLMSEIILGTA